MLLENIIEKELTFLETWYTPKALIECLFGDFDNLGKFEPDKFGHVRLYQEPMVSDESLIDFDLTAKHHNLNEKQKFKLRKKVGDLINVGARLYGKTLMTLRLDIVLSILHDKGCPTALFSIDEKRIRGVLDHVKSASQYHPIVRIWGVNCGYKPEIKFYSKKSHWLLQGVNLIIKGKSPGDQWYQIHAKKIWGEEVSFETEKVSDKRIEAVSELGAVIRLAGMTNFTKHSPIGKEFCDLKNKNQIINYPQSVNPFWDEEEKERRKKKYGGADTTNYKIFVEGKIVEDGVSEFDMERIHYIKSKEIKHFEISKERFLRFKNMIVVERPKNAERIFINADIGDKTTKIIAHSEVGEIYNYIYKISLYNLIKDEQLEVFEWLINKLKANIVGLDCGEAFGRILADDLEKTYSKENVVRYAGASKIRIGFEEDENGNVKTKNGEPVYKEEYMSEWAVDRLKILLYNERCHIPIDYEFDKQFNAVVSTTSGTRRIYKCLNEDDHDFDAWKVFATAQWLKKDFNDTPEMNQEWGVGVSGEI